MAKLNKSICQLNTYPNTCACYGAVNGHPCKVNHARSTHPCVSCRRRCRAVSAAGERTSVRPSHVSVCCARVERTIRNRRRSRGQVHSSIRGPHH